MLITHELIKLKFNKQQTNTQLFLGFKSEKTPFILSFYKIFAVLVSFVQKEDCIVHQIMSWNYTNCRVAMKMVVLILLS